MKESFGFIERADKVSEVRFLNVTIQFSINTVKPCFTNTSLFWTVVFVPEESPQHDLLNKKLSMEPSVSVLITGFDCAGCLNVVYYFIS